MAITQAVPVSFKQELLEGVHDFENDTFMIALYTSSANLDASTTVYTTTGEVTGAGYTAGGNTLTGGAVGTDGAKGIVDFDDSVWTSASFTARGALIYNSTDGNRAVAVIDFGADNTVAAGEFTARFPAFNASNAILRIN